MADALKEFTKNLSEAAKELAQKEQVKENLDQDIKDLSRQRDSLREGVNEAKNFIALSEGALREAKRKHETLLENENSKLQAKIQEFKKEKEEHSKKLADLEKRELELEKQRSQFKDEVRAYKESALSKSEQYKKLLAGLGLDK